MLGYLFCLDRWLTVGVERCRHAPDSLVMWPVSFMRGLAPPHSASTSSRIAMATQGCGRPNQSWKKERTICFTTCWLFACTGLGWREVQVHDPLQTGSWPRLQRSDRLPKKINVNRVIINDNMTSQQWTNGLSSDYSPKNMFVFYNFKSNTTIKQYNNLLRT